MTFDFKTATPDTSLDANAFVFGADTQASASPSIYQLSVLKTFMSDSPTLVTPVLGVATATTINKVALTAPATGSTLTIADGKTLTASNTLTFTGTDASSVAFGTGGTVAYTGGKLSQFAATTSAELAGVISDETGTGALVFANSPTFTDDITLGTQQTTQGSIILANTAAGAFATTIKASNSASAAWALTLPTTAGTNGYVLQTDGTGVTSWVAGGGGVTIDTTAITSGTAQRVLFESATNKVTESAEFTFTAGTGLTLTGTGAGASAFVFQTSGAGGYVSTMTSGGTNYLMFNAGGADSFFIGGSFYPIVIRSDSAYGFASGTNPGTTSPDTQIRRGGAAATIQQGAADAAAPVAQTTQVQSVVAGTSNTAGANWTFNASRGTGTGAGGSIIFQVAPAGTTGTAQNALATALTIDSTKKLTVPGVLALTATPSSSDATLQLGSNATTGFAGYSGVDLIEAKLNGTRYQYWRAGNPVFFDQKTIALGSYSNANILLGQPSDGVLQFAYGAASSFLPSAGDVAAPSALTMQMQSVVAGTSNTAGVDWTFNASRGTGTGAGGKIIFKTAPAGGSGTSQNAASSAWEIDSNLTLYPGASLATNMTQGFINIPGAAGAASGTPANTTGFPMYYDSTNNKIYVYNGSWRSTAALT